MDDQKLARLRATAHPLRLQMLSLLTGAAMSAAELARHLDVSQANASYHLRQLADAGLVQLVEETSVRGGRAKRYRHAPDRHEPDLDDTDADPTPNDTRAMCDALARELGRRAARRAPGAHTLTADAELWVEADTWQDVLDRVRAAMLDLHDAARPPGSPGTVRTSSSVALFAMEEPPRPGGAAPDRDRG